MTQKCTLTHSFLKIHTININVAFLCCQVVVKQNATAEQLKQRKSLAAAEREENQRSGT